MAKVFYTTTAIDYPNGLPHIGHVYEKIVTDTYARWYRFLGYEVRYLTGTDENGQKLVKAAAESGESDTKKFIDQNVETFRKLCKDLELTHNDFIRTTDERHVKVCQEIWQILEQNGDIYFDRYSGNYCLNCETFYTDSQAPEGKCPEHHQSLEFVEEDGYFFRLSKYGAWISEHISSHQEFIFPRSARKEILSRLSGDDLRDLSISRPNAGWGIAVPKDGKYVMYTWFDALINYYAAVRDEPFLSKFWPASMHVIGKDITWFHAVIWPVMLHAAGIELPKQIHVHGMLLGADGKKMSKSLGNVVNPYDIIGHFPLDVLRYYLLRAVASGQDGKFSLTDMIARNNNELANDFGNLVSRVVKLTQKRLGDETDVGDTQGEFDFSKLIDEISILMESREHNRALDLIWEKIGLVNSYLNKYEPWRIKDDPKRFKNIMVNCLYAVNCFAIVLEPFLPQTSQVTLKMLGSNEIDAKSAMNFAPRKFKFGEVEPLFPKIEDPKN